MNRRGAAGVGLLVVGGAVSMLAGIWPALSIGLPVPHAGLVVAAVGAICVAMSVYVLSTAGPDAR